MFFLSSVRWVMRYINDLLMLNRFHFIETERVFALYETHLSLSVQRDREVVLESSRLCLQYPVQADNLALLHGLLLPLYFRKTVYGRRVGG